MRYKVKVYTLNEDTNKYEKTVAESSLTYAIIDDDLAIELIRILTGAPYCTCRIFKKFVSFTWYPDEIHKEIHFFKIGR